MDDPNLCLSTPGPYTIHALRPVECQLGQIIFAGTKWNSQATYAHGAPPDYLRPTPHNLIVYTLEGEANYRDDTGLKTVLKKGSVVWSRPGVNQSYGPRPGTRWSEFFMWFSGPIFETWQNCGYPGECSKLFLLEPVSYWMTRFREIVETEKTAVESSHVLRLCRFQQILAEGMQIEEFWKMNAESSAWRQKACQLLSGGTPAETSLVSIAKSMNLSYTVFRKRFVHLTGTTPGKFRTGEIMKRACTSLINTNSALSEIAESLGFHDQFHFSRRFKQEFGLSPSEFRRQVPMESR